MAVNIFTDDLHHILSDLRKTGGGVRVVFGSQATDGIEDVQDEALFVEAQMFGVQRTVRVRTGSLTGLVVNSTLAVDGTSYKVMHPPQRLDDGSMTLLALGTA